MRAVLMQSTQALSDFALFGIVPCIDVYKIFRYELMHASSLAFSSTIDLFPINMLGDSITRTCCALARTSRAPLNFSQVCDSVLAMLSGFSRNIEKESAGLNTQKAPRRRLIWQNFCAFTKNGFLSLLKASYFLSNDNLFLILSVLVDWTCGNHGGKISKGYT